MSAPLREHLTGHIVVWIASVSKSQGSLSFLERYLDRHDRERAGKFKFAEDRARFVIGRSLIRKCLGQYLEVPPDKIELGYTDLGRPFLPAEEFIRFNITHTNDFVAIAVTAYARLGIDIEYIQPHPDLLELANRIFSEKDHQIFQALPAAEKVASFFRIWTRKEAYLKARGEGIAEGLQDISASFGPEETGTITDARDSFDAPVWRMTTLPLPADYMGSLACDDPAKALEIRQIRFEKGEITDDMSFRLK